MGPSGDAGAGETAAWLYVADPADSALGAALVWADRRAVDELHVLADGHGRQGGDGDDAVGVMARRAGWFAGRAPSIWRVGDPRGPEPLVAADPAPLPELRTPPPAPELVDVLRAAGVEVVTEGGVVRGEVNGLEVARIVHGTSTAGVPLDAALLEVGVGAADRELTAMVHGGVAPVDQLARAVDIVRRHRRVDAPRHPLGQLVPERWLRAVLVRDPALVGLASLAPAEGARPRPNLSDVDVAVAQGTTPDGAPVVAVCSVGIDVELVPAAADARALLDPGAGLWLVVPERDDHPVTRRLAARLGSPARVVTVPDGWRAFEKPSG